MYRDKIKASLQRISIGSFLFQSEIAREFALHPSDLEAISHLSLHGRLTAGELSARLHLTSGATTTLVDRLETCGFVERKRDKGDKRRVFVQLRGRNVSRLQLRYAEIENRIANALDALSLSEQAAVASFLTVIAEAPKTDE